MIATIARSSGNSFTSYNARAYDAWGNVRAGQGSGDPKNRYCGSLGHQQDDESGLIYMRARYYEPGSGRLISQDSGHQGNNWFAFAGDNPVRGKDFSGSQFFFDDGEELFLWFNHVGRDPAFGSQIQQIVLQFNNGAINAEQAAGAMAAIWYNLAANFYPGTVAGVNGAWQLCVKIPETLVDILTESFDWGEGVSGAIEDVVEDAAEMSFTWLEDLPG